MTDDIPDDITLRQRALRDAHRSIHDFTRCRFCDGPWHGLPRAYPTGETCHGSHEGSKGKTIDGR